MNRCEQAIQDYLKVYGRLEISDLEKFFDINGDQADDTNLNQIWRTVFMERGLPTRHKCVKCDAEASRLYYENVVR